MPMWATEMRPRPRSALLPTITPARANDTESTYVCEVVGDGAGTGASNKADGVQVRGEDQEREGKPVEVELEEVEPERGGEYSGAFEMQWDLIRFKWPASDS
jgi:hypothetical protein